MPGTWGASWEGSDPARLARAAFLAGAERTEHEVRRERDAGEDGD